MGWTFFFLMVVLKVPILALALLVWWAIRAEVAPVTEADQGGEDDGGSKIPEAHRTRPRRPRRPRGPHGAPMSPSPPRVREPAAARARAKRTSLG